MSKFHVDQIATHLKKRYAADHWRDDLDEVNNLSRLLGLYSLDLVLGDAPSAPQRIIEVTDGSKDRGIDAIAVDPVANLLVLSQSKWRQNGTGSLDVGETLRFVDGVRSLVGAKSGSEPVHASEELREAVRELLITPSAQVRMVTVTSGSAPLAPEVLAPISTFLNEMNDLEGVDPIAVHSHLGQADLFRSLSDVQRQAIDLEIDLLNWGGGTAEPLRIFYGKVSGADVASWYAEHGANLFSENIRVVIPRSEINTGMAQTVRESPEKFGYYNNGITVLATAVKTSPAGLLNRDVLRVGLDSASVVNGAQTVSTLGSLLGTAEEKNLSRVFVLTKCIEVPADDPGIARGITRYANTQNEVSSQDFAFLDEQQHRLAHELGTLGYEYVIRQAEQPVTDDPATIIYLRDAAVALACAADDVGLAVTAKREVSRLFSQSGAEYRRIFNPATDPLLLLRSVLILRKVDAVLNRLANGASGVDLGVAVHGRLVVAHEIMRWAGRAAMSDPDWDVEDFLGQVPDAVKAVADSLSAFFPDNSYPGNVFKNRARVVELLADAGLGTG